MRAAIAFLKSEACNELSGARDDSRAVETLTHAVTPFDRGRPGIQRVAMETRSPQVLPPASNICWVFITFLNVLFIKSI